MALVRISATDSTADCFLTSPPPLSLSPSFLLPLFFRALLPLPLLTPPDPFLFLPFPPPISYAFSSLTFPPSPHTPSRCSRGQGLDHRISPASFPSSPFFPLLHSLPSALKSCPPSLYIHPFPPSPLCVPSFPSFLLHCILPSFRLHSIPPLLSLEFPSLYCILPLLPSAFHPSPPSVHCILPLPLSHCVPSFPSFPLHCILLLLPSAFHPSHPSPPSFFIASFSTPLCIASFPTFRLGCMPPYQACLPSNLSGHICSTPFFHADYGTRVARRAVVRSQATTEEAPIAFQIGETSLSIPFSVERAKALDAAISTLLQTFREKEKATRPQRWTTMEFRHAGDVSNGDVFIEVFCNPNAYANAFQAKALITVKDDRMKFTSEGALSAIKANVDEYLMRNA
ncbi:unnamed protein product [Closterium sp. Naga37s-1]|nr:unnamed protein product [Closterium sp. Naga37s-1]